MSKRIFQHPPEQPGAPKYWRSLDQLADTPQFREWAEREFPQGAAELSAGEVSRRGFLKFMGASAALAGLAACRRPEKHLVPFTASAEWTIPGKALFYASSMPTRRGAIPLIVTTHDGRPTKIEGNHLHPFGTGATDTWAQSSILDLYDPERSRRFALNGVDASEEAFLQALRSEIATLKATGGAGLAFLAGRDMSPTRERLRKLIAATFPASKWCEYEPLGDDAVRAAARTAFGTSLRLRPQLAKADVVVALDCDFLGCPHGDLEAIRDFAARRRVDARGGEMNRLYAIEPHYTVTGGMADHRLRLAGSQIGPFACALAKRVGVDLGAFVAQDPGDPADAAWLDGLARDLLAHRGHSLVMVGPQHSEEIQLLVLAINDALDNLNETLVGLPAEEAPALPIASLASEISRGAVTHLVILGGNPAYDAPADLGWSALQKTVPYVFRLGSHEDETSAVGGWHIPAAHYLESWRDGLSADGTYVSGQPMILPLFGGWSENDLLALFAGLQKPEGPELVQDTFRERFAPADFDSAWNLFLLRGFVEDSAPGPQPLTFNPSAVQDKISGGLALAAPPNRDGLEILFVGCPKVDDGRYNNNAWLQELPDPITKLTWDNAAQISIATAKELGLSTYGIKTDLGEKKMGQYVREIIAITLPDGRNLEAVALISPGHADHSITLTLGYGRSVVGEVGRGTGYNAYPLRTSAQPYIALGAKVAVTEKRRELAIVQDHYSMEGRALVRETTLEKYNTEENREFIRQMGMDSHIPGEVSLYTNPPLDDPNQWGMAVDLNTCTGCNACVVACQAENNIPIVGKEQVVNGRSMHWLRLDRYFGGDDVDNPQMVMEPMMCQHCENAPCETVCPVNATIHSEDGLNLMAYNRCIGTRYCANNCPFKVRRFNFFDYNERKVIDHSGGLFSGLHKWNLVAPKGMEDTRKMQKNPNVTVRMRGVMEKCTFCIQRIQEAKIAAKVKAADSRYEGVKEAFKVACQQACPAGAIEFGNLNDPGSKVSQLRKQDKNYELLKYLNLKTRVTYLARLKNPNKAIPGWEKIGQPDDDYNQPHHGVHHAGDSHGAHDAPAAKAEAHH